VSSIALFTLSHLAIGLGDGPVLLYRHIDQSIFSSSISLTSLPKPRTIHESPTEPITVLGFGEPSISSAHEAHTNGRVSGANPSIVDEVGAGLGCVVIDWLKREIVVAREEAVYVCGVEGRGSCYAYEGVYLSSRFSLYFGHEIDGY
jgi:vacuolar protein sorting-associated protein 11